MTIDGTVIATAGDEMALGTVVAVAAPVAIEIITTGTETHIAAAR